MLRSRRNWHTEGKIKLCWPNSLSPPPKETPNPKPIGRVYVAGGFTCISHLLPTRFPFQINKYTTYPNCKASKGRVGGRRKVCVAWATTPWGAATAVGMTKLDFAGQAKGEAEESSIVLLAALASAVLACFYSSHFQEPAASQGSCSLQQLLVLHPSQGKANKKAWAGCLQDLHGKVLFARTNTFLNHGCEQLIAL